jgi:hypothetical protein
MGILDIFRRRVEETYVLKRQLGSGGMAKVAEVAANEASLEEFMKTDLCASLTRGRYSVHAYKKGKSGFRVVWGPLALGRSEAEAEAMAAAPRIPREVDAAALEKAMKPILEAKKIVDAFDKTFGRGALLNSLKSLKAEYDELGGLFGTKQTTTADEPLQYEGKLPAWAHPKAVVGTVNQVLDTIETRGKRWGLIGEENQPKEELLKLPERPTASSTNREVAFKTEDMKDVEESDSRSD